MKFLFIFFCAFFLLVSTGFAESKFAIVEVQKLIDDSNKGKILKDNLRKKFQPQEDSLKQKEGSLRKLQNEIQSSLIKESVKQKKKLEFETLQAEYTKESQAFLAAVRAAEQEQTRIILKELKEIVEKFGKKEGYDFIFEKSVEQFILFNKNSLDDVTEEIIKQYDKI
jgi:outer membrane protein